MQVEAVNKQPAIISIGDVVTIGTDAYLIMKIDGTVRLRNFNGSTEYDKYKSIEELVKDIKKNDGIIYSSSDYKIKIVEY